MSVQLLPEIGATGVYQLNIPFATALVPGVRYTCRAIRKLNDFTVLGVDPFETYYAPAGLSKAKYETDFADGVCIVSLQSGVGKWVYVPSSYIKSFPNSNGIKYSVVVMGVSLGAIPDSMDTSSLQALVSDVVYGALGVQPTFKNVVVSAPMVIPSEDHLALEAMRVSNLTIRETLGAKITRLQAEKAALQFKLSELEQWVINNP